MARVQLVMADDDRDRFVHQARQEGLSLSAWLRTSASKSARASSSSSHLRTLRSFSGHALRWKAQRRSRTGMNTCAS